MAPSEIVLRELLAAAPDALIAVDPGGRIMFVNDQAEWLFGWPRHDLIGQQVECLVPEEFVAGHPKLRADYVDNPTKRPTDGMRLSARRRDGSEFPAEISLNSFTTSEGTLVAVAIRDATVARQSEQRLRAILDAAPDATIGVNTAGRIEMVNAHAERLFGWSATELMGKQVEMLVPGAIAHRHVQHRAEYLAAPQTRPMGASALSALRKDGSTFPAEISLSTVTDDDGEVMVLAAVRDIRDRIEYELERHRSALESQQQQLHRLESLGQLAGGVAHDFNNLLGVILNYATLMSRHVIDSAAMADLGEIRAAAERGAALTAQLLTFARRNVVDRQPIDMAAVVSNVASMLTRTLGAHIDLRVDLDDPPVFALCDRGQLEQIVMNLVINARDAMPDGGTLTISAGRVPESAASPQPALLRVTDTGCGMSDEVVAHAFEPFFTTKTRGRGTGLGLATVYGIVRQSEGAITIESVTGQGTTVSVQLPGATEPHTRPVEPVALTAATERPRRHERILLVEDEFALRVGTARLLEDAGYEVVVAADGLEALDIVDASASAFDVVVTDVAMPRMRGDELAVQLKLRTSDLPVIFMTGYNSGATALTGPVLAKPVLETDLLQTLREVLDV